MDSINNIVLDEEIFLDSKISCKELTEEQRKRLDNGQIVRLPDGGIMFSILVRTTNDRVH